MFRKVGLWAALFGCFSLMACAQPANLSLSATALSQVTIVAPTLPATNTPVATATLVTAQLPTSPPATAAVTPTATATPFLLEATEGACGQQLPILAADTAVTTTQLNPDSEALAQLEAIIPNSARPALAQLLGEPQTVGLVAYRLGQEANGVYLNADTPMPLASVAKLIHLVAYAEAVAAGRLDPFSAVALSEMENYYLPRSDLGAHQRAVEDLEANGRTFADPPHILLDEVPGLMIRYSSNAATDYLHMLLGQEVIEQTAVDLGLSSQTAPCPFLGQFLVMANHTRSSRNDQAALSAYLIDPTLYGQEVMALTEAFSQDEDFRTTEIAWRAEERRPNLDTQAFFTTHLNAQGSARDYATLMARLAQNGLSNGESSFIARRFLEWPMRFEANQELFDNLGYKNGRLPGVLTTVYYAYPRGETTPIVVTLFFRDLPNDTYRQWRNDLPHDEFARWLLYDPAALPALRVVINEP